MKKKSGVKEEPFYSVCGRVAEVRDSHRSAVFLNSELENIFFFFEKQIAFPLSPKE